MTEKTRKAVEQFVAALDENVMIECKPYYFGVTIETIRKYVSIKRITVYEENETISYNYLYGWDKWMAGIFADRHNADDKKLAALVRRIKSNFDDCFGDEITECDSLSLFMDLRYLSDADLCKAWDECGQLVVKDGEWVIERRYHKSRNFWIR